MDNHCHVRGTAAVSGNNALKTPYFQTFGKGVQRRITNAAELQGKALPCTVAAVTGSIVTVTFDVLTAFTLPRVTMPTAFPKYIRVPLQPGDKGLAVPADIPIAGAAGLGGGINRATPPSNLGALLFVPVGSAAFEAVDPMTLVLSGPNGVLLQDEAATTTVSITPTAILMTNATSVAMVSGGSSVTVTPAGVAIVGTLTINGAPYLLHTHAVTTAPGTTGPVL